MRPSLIPGRTTNYPIAIATCAWLGAISVAQASAPALLQEPGSKNSFPEYRTGDVATRDIIAPFEIAVVNAERTERLRQQELDKLPAIYRFDPWVTLRTEENFSQAFSRTRAAFLENMEIAARQKILDEATIEHASFWRFVAWFKGGHSDFPITTNLATLWALGRPDDALRVQLQSCLQDISSRYIRADDLPSRADTAEVEVVTSNDASARLTLADVEASAETVARTQIWALSEARAELAGRCAQQMGRDTIGVEEQETIKFLCALLKENVSFDGWLTQQKRQARAAELVVFEQYSPGQVLVRAGQIVDVDTKAALDVLSTALKRQESRAALPRISSSSFKFPAWDSEFSIFVLVAFAGLFLVGLWWFFTGRPVKAVAQISEAYTVAMDPSRNETVLLPMTHAGSEPAMQWQGQLREAEQRAEDLLALVRAGLAPHLAKELTHKLVQQLAFQRVTLLRAHRLAEQEIVALEMRFDKVCRELQERVSIYEKRTAELEKELVSKSEQTRQLMNATILLTQEKVAQKKAVEPFACN